MQTIPRTLGKVLAVLALALTMVAPTTAFSAQTATHSAPAQVALGAQLTVTGTGWLNQAGTEGSVVAVKLDGGGESATFDVVNPVGGNVVGNKTIWAIAKADSAGNLSVSFPLPDGSNNASGRAWEAGSTHQYTLLTGSLLPGDTIRSLSGRFTVVPPPGEPGEPGQEPSASVSPSASASASASVAASASVSASTSASVSASASASVSAPASVSASASALPSQAALTCTPGELRFEHRDRASGQNAVVCVQREVSTAPGAKLVVRGEAWGSKEAGQGALVVIKLGSRPEPSAADFQFARVGDEVLRHPRSGAPDASIWAIVRAGADGSFRAELDVPQVQHVPDSVGAAGRLKAGSKLVVNLRSGLNPADSRHDITTDSLVLDGRAYGGDAAEEITACVPASAEPRAWVEYPAGQEENPVTGPVFDFGAKLRLRGAGWCHNADPATGGAVIGVKIDEGAFSHVKGETVASNATIWAIVKVDSADGSFDTEITLPTAGSGAGASTPEFTEGSHTLRLLTGSLKPGGTSRTLKTGHFTVGKYKPNGLPKLVSRDQVRQAPAGGLTASLRGSALHVELPGAAGAWLFLSGFAADGSPRFFTGDWVKLDQRGRAVVPVDLRQVPTGAWTVVAQHPNGAIAGWTSAFRAGQPERPSGQPTAGAGRTAAPAVSAPPSAPPRRNAAALLPAVPEVKAQPVKPQAAAALPVARIDELTPANRGEIGVDRSGDVLTLTLPPSVVAGSWVALHLYPLKATTDWLQVDPANQVRLNLAGIAPGRHRVALTGADSTLLGWVPLDLTEASPSPAVPSGTASPAASAQASVDDAASAPAITVAAASTSAGEESNALSANDWLLIAAAAVLLLGAGAAYALLRPSRTR